MSYDLFIERFPELGWKETRSATMFANNSYGLPADEYGLIEAYCSDKDCDCRRVFLNIASRKKEEIIAVVTYGWETKAFYQKWFGGIDNEISRQAVKEMVGLGLNSTSPQSNYANAALKLVEELLQDQNYVTRLKRHYQMYKEKVDPKHFHQRDEASKVTAKPKRHHSR